MLTKLILPGEKIELQSMEKSILGSASDKKSYISRIYDVLSDDQFEVLMPMEQTKLILLPVDGEYDVCIPSRDCINVMSGSQIVTKRTIPIFYYAKQSPI